MSIVSRTFLKSTGEILDVIQGDLYSIELNTPSNSMHVDNVKPNNLSDYWDYDSLTFVAIGNAPTEYHQFNYTSKEWFDPRPLDEIKAQKWVEIKSQRDRLEFGGFEFDGNIYDSDQVSQGRIMGAAAAVVDQLWTLANNSTVELSASQLQQLYVALQVHVASVHERGRIARVAIETASTKEEVERIQL